VWVCNSLARGGIQQAAKVLYEGVGARDESVLFVGGQSNQCFDVQQNCRIQLLR
jgi:hypothetical protein